MPPGLVDRYTRQCQGEIAPCGRPRGRPGRSEGEGEQGEAGEQGTHYVGQATMRGMGPQTINTLLQVVLLGVEAAKSLTAEAPDHPKVKEVITPELVGELESALERLRRKADPGP